MKEYILPVRDLVVHPDLTVPVFVDSPLSIACIEAATKNQKRLVLCAQHSWSYPSSAEQLFSVGTIGDIAQVLHMPDGAIHAIIQTTDVVDLSNISVENGVFSGDITPVEILDDSNFEQTLALRDKVTESMRLLSTTRKFKLDRLQTVIQNYPMAAFVDAVIQMADIDTTIAVDILKMKTWREKLIALLEQIALAIETEKIENNINRRVQMQMESGHRQAILQEKMRAIQKEMGEDDGENDTLSIRKKIELSAMPMDAKEKAMAEFKRMRTMSPMSQEGGLLKTYLEELLAMPWNKSSQAPIDLKNARNILDTEHSGMNAVKERILEHIAVMKKTGKNRGSILCLKYYEHFLSQ